MAPAPPPAKHDSPINGSIFKQPSKEAAYRRVNDLLARNVAPEQDLLNEL